MKFGYCMPTLSPLYPEPPITFTDNDMISVLFRSSPATLRALVPAPLLPNPDNLAFVYIGNLNIDSPLKGKYKEAGLGIPVLFNGKPGNFFAVLYLDSTPAIAAGREIWGWPKKDAAITYTVDGGEIRASVTREGVTLVSVSVQAVQPVKPIPSGHQFPAINLKIIPSVEKNGPPAVLQLTSTPTVAEKKKLARGTATLTFQSSPSDELGKINIVEIISGEHSIENLRLDYGEILYDYLSE